MKQRNRIKKLQLFMYTTGRMAPPAYLKRSADGYPGERYVKTTLVDGKKRKWSYSRYHLMCRTCDGYGTVYTVLSNMSEIRATCPSCNGRMYSEKSYRLD